MGGETALADGLGALGVEDRTTSRSWEVRQALHALVVVPLIGIADVWARADRILNPPVRRE
jgi:hypothetical protein